MYDLFSTPSRRFNGRLHFPTLPYLRRSFAEAILDVKTYYRKHPKRVDSDCPLGNILLHLSRQWGMDDRRYVRYVEDASKGLIRVFGFTSSVNTGKLHRSGVTLGRDTEEAIISVESDIDFTRAKATWREWRPMNYLYHTRTDLGLPVLNNHQPGRGFGVATLNLPMMALQYRYWLAEAAERGDQAESVYRFIGSVVLPNALDSYLDIAFFNHISRTARGIGTQKFPSPHPFYLTDYTDMVQRVSKQIVGDIQSRNEDIEQMIFAIPMLVHEDLLAVMQLPKDPVTRHNEWALQLARLPYVRFAIQHGVIQHQGDRHYLNEARQSLIEASNDRIFSGIGSAEAIKMYRTNIRNLITEIEEKM